MNISRDEILYLLKNNPIEIGHWVGFKDLTELHNEWLKLFLYSDRDITLQAHRGSYKTTTLSLFLSIHTIINPLESVMYFRKTGSDVAEISRQVANILSSGCMHKIGQILYGQDYGITKRTNTEIDTSLNSQVTGSSQIVGLGIGTSITGKHADIVITDDIVNINDRISQADREYTKIAYQELINIKNRGGRFINTGTPWHKEDAFTLMPDPIKFDCYQTGLITQEGIENLKKKMSPSLFAANYELKHIASEGALFDTMPQWTEDMESLRDGIAHIDAAYGGEDSTAFTCGKRVGNKLYMYGRIWPKHFDKCIDECIRKASELRCAPFYCEDADKGFVARELRAKNVSVRTYHENDNKYMKISTYLRKWWNDIIWLKGTDSKYIDEIMDYTEDAAHDDAPDSASCVCRLFDRRNNEGYISPFGG